MSKSRWSSDGEFDLRDDWPVPSYDLMAVAKREEVRNRIRAMALRLNGYPYKLVERLTGVKRKAVYHMLKRAQMIAPDGQPYGYRVVLPHLQIDAKNPTHCMNHPWYRVRWDRLLYTESALSAYIAATSKAPRG